jgi:hypothetical protein
VRTSRTNWAKARAPEVEKAHTGGGQ